MGDPQCDNDSMRPGNLIPCTVLPNILTNMGKPIHAMLNHTQAHRRSSSDHIY